MQLQPHVGNFDPGQFEDAARIGAIVLAQRGSDPLRQVEAGDLALLGAPEGLRGRRGAAEEERGAGFAGQELGHGPGVVTRRLALLVRLIVFLIEH